MGYGCSLLVFSGKNPSFLEQEFNGPLRWERGKRPHVKRNGPPVKSIFLVSAKRKKTLKITLKYFFPLLRYPALEEQLVSLFVTAMEEAETSPAESSALLWRSLASELIFFILYQYLSFASFIERLCDELENRRDLKKGRTNSGICRSVLSHFSFFHL